MKIHPKFKLNGFSFTNDGLLDVAYSLIKEGEPFEREIGDFLFDWLNDKPFVVVNTSGSTGKPKEIHLLKENIINSAKATGGFFNLQEEDSALLCLPAQFIAGKMMLVRAMVLGLELDYVKPDSNPLSGVTKNYDFAAMIPLQAQNSLAKLGQIEQLIVGGAPINLQLDKALGESDNVVYGTYGMTETITHIAVRKCGEPNFKALPNVSLTKDKRECLVIDAPLISEEKVITNDIVELTSENEFNWLGRYDSVINSGGVKLIPEQIALGLSPLIKKRFFITGLPDDSLGEKVVLLVEGKEEPELLQKIKLQSKLSKFEIPKAIHFLPEFVETDNGKLNRIKTLELL